MANHVNGKTPQGLENHDSIVSSYKELIREQVNTLEPLFIHLSSSQIILTVKVSSVPRFDFTKTAVQQLNVMFISLSAG